jgi:hypothetical protein
MPIANATLTAFFFFESNGHRKNAKQKTIRA